MFEFEGIRTKWIDDMDDKFAICEDGRVVSYVTSKPKFKKLSFTVSGYVKVVMKHHRDGEIIQKTTTAHRLVAKAFVDGETEEKNQVDHIDGDKTNNHYTNLRWVSAKENIDYFHSNRLGEDGLRYQKTVAEVNARIELLQREIRGLRNDKKRIESELGQMKIKHLQTEVMLNGVRFDSLGSASQYIVDEEDRLGNVRKHNTIRKEIGHMVKGSRKPWKMYGRYLIDKVA